MLSPVGSQKEETETAYLKILSEEAAKRDAERERVTSQKLAELEKKEKDLNRQRKQLEDKEEILKQLDNEVTFYSSSFRTSIMYG